MRPVKRPTYTGYPYKDYKSFLKPLLAAFGEYCSYCERPDKLDVEHVAPQSKNPDLKTDWNNLLLGCPRCNRDYKKSKNDNRDGYVWPDEDNTFALLKYLVDGRVKPANGLTVEIKKAVEKAIELVKLDDGELDQQVLNRARNRKFRIAYRAREKYLNGHQTLSEIEDQAAEGLWSVWYTVFQDIEEVRQRLLTSDHFPNTQLS